MAALFMVAMCVGVASCSKDDEPKGGGGAFTGKRVTKIETTWHYGNDSDTYTEEFEYSNGKLIKYDDYCEITYEGNKVMITYGSDSFTYTLGDNGYATSAAEIYRGNRTHDYTFEYSKDGYLTKWTAFDLRDNHSYGIEFFYSNKNIVNYLAGSDEYEFTYTGLENKGGVLNPQFAEGYDEHDIAYYAGILGKPTKNLVKAETFIENSSSWGHTYTYTLDDNGYIIKMQEKNDEGELTKTVRYTFE